MEISLVSEREAARSIPEEIQKKLNALRDQRVALKNERKNLVAGKKPTGEVDAKLEKLQIETEQLNGQVFGSRNQVQSEISGQRRDRALEHRKESAKAFSGMSIAELEKRRADLTAKRMEDKFKLAAVVTALDEAKALEELLRLAKDLSPEQKELLKKQL